MSRNMDIRRKQIPVSSHNTFLFPLAVTYLNFSLHAPAFQDFDVLLDRLGCLSLASHLKVVISGDPLQGGAENFV